MRAASQCSEFSTCKVHTYAQSTQKLLFLQCSRPLSLTRPLPFGCTLDRRLRASRFGFCAHFAIWHFQFGVQDAGSFLLVIIVGPHSQRQDMCTTCEFPSGRELSRVVFTVGLVVMRLLSSNRFVLKVGLVVMRLHFSKGCLQMALTTDHN